MNFLVPFNENISVEKVGNKFLNLSKINIKYPVPKAVCITTDIFREIMGEKNIKFMEKFFEDLNATVGCFLLSSMPELNNILNELEFSREHEADLSKQLNEFFGEVNRKRQCFAVRSSGVGEDSSTYSFAGVYISKLGVRGIRGICESIIECWKAYYSYSAIAARVRANCFDPYPKMAVIIQHMVNAEIAGVAFALKDKTLLEYVYGTGEDLVSGIKAAEKYVKENSRHKEGATNSVLEDVCSLAESISIFLGYEVDMEWAWNGSNIYVLQVRPVTVSFSKNTQLDVPVFYISRLYLDISLPIGMQLGDCQDVYMSYMSKRGDSYRKAQKNGIASGKGYVLDFNKSGFLQKKDVITKLFEDTETEKLVLDINNNIRQVIINTKDLFEYLKSTFNLDSNSPMRHNIIIREYISGNCGIISRIVEGNSLLLEYSKDGLLSINRGTTDCRRIHIRDINKPLINENIAYDQTGEESISVTNAIPQIKMFTSILNEDIPGTQVEWVLENDNPFFIDFSSESNVLYDLNNAENIVISSGICQGFALNLSDEATLHRLSVGAAISVTGYHEVAKHETLNAIINTVTSYPNKPIIFVNKPYVILSVLFDHVAGFVFGEGSLLCHLSILLREAGIPAVICKDAPIEDGDEIMIVNEKISVLAKRGGN